MEESNAKRTRISPIISDAGRRVLLALCLSAGLVPSMSGCGKDKGEKFVAVTGKVTFADGSPLTTGTVIFHADPSKGNTTKHEPRGTIDDQGNYKLATAGKEGAPLGWYKVCVEARKSADDPANPYAVGKSVIDTKFGSPDTSKLEKEVVEKPAAGAYDLQVSK